MRLTEATDEAHADLPGDRPGLLAAFAVVVETALSSVTLLSATQGYDLHSPSVPDGARVMAIGWAALVGLTGLACLVLAGHSFFKRYRSRVPPNAGLVATTLTGLAGLILVPTIASGDVTVAAAYLLLYVAAFSGA